MKHALEVLASLDGRVIYSAELARLLWPDNPAVIQNRMQGVSMTAAGLVSRLRNKGYVSGALGAKYGIVLTPEGRRYLRSHA